MTCDPMTLWTPARDISKAYLTFRLGVTCVCVCVMKGHRGVRKLTGLAAREGAPVPDNITVFGTRTQLLKPCFLSHWCTRGGPSYSNRPKLWSKAPPTWQRALACFCSVLGYWTLNGCSLLEMIRGFMCPHLSFLLNCAGVSQIITLLTHANKCNSCQREE